MRLLGPELQSLAMGQLRGMAFASGSMKPKVEAACRFVTATGGRAAVGSIQDALRIVQGCAGTVIVAD
jgi:carbamate kinase